MEVLILAWYVLVETGSVLLLTLFGALQYVGALFSPLFGVAGDRAGHRNVLVVMRTIYATLALALMTLAFAGWLTPPLVFLIAFLSGIVRPSDLAMRSALIGQTMPPEVLAGAMGIARTTSDSARVAGSIAGAGLFALLGMGWAYVVIALFYVAGLLLTLGVAAKGTGPVSATPLPDPPSAATAPRASPWRDLKEDSPTSGTRRACWR